MHRSAIFLLLAAWPALGACRSEETPAPAAPALPFGDRPIEDRSFAMASAEGDTAWFQAGDAGEGRVRLVRYQRADGGLDSLAAEIDAATKRPVSSHQRITTSEGPVTGDIAYGAGYQGEAVRTVTTPAGRLEENLRTPDPYLDMAQIPQTLAAIDLTARDTLHFNYVSPFEELARSALLVVGAPVTLDLASGSVSAVPVRLRVSGQEETFWFARDEGGARLVRWRDHRRGVTRDRVEMP
jgi:hypothetical protein